MDPERNLIFTIGHSDHSFESLVGLLHKHGITAIADVRSSPYSARSPQFNKEELKTALRIEGIAYVFLGVELGGRPRRSEFFCEGVADYEKMAQAQEFKTGLARVIRGTETQKIALMCSERDPLDCHRCLLVGRELARSQINIAHILPDGSAIPHDTIEDRLLKTEKRNRSDLFASRFELLEIAYRTRARRVAYVRPNNSNKEHWESRA